MNTITPEDIISIELGLINKCVLNCRLCLRQEDIAKGLKKDEAIDSSQLFKFLDKLSNLQQVDLVGSVSEPTLHKQIKEIIKYIKSRNLKIRLSTNGNTFSLKWWEELGALMNSEDIVRFAIDGSTQEIHSKYRVGGKLSKVLDCHRHFKKSSKAVTVLQNILFTYNINDQENIKKLALAENFDICEFTHTGNSFFSEDAKLREDNILPVKDLLFEYQKLDMEKKNLNLGIECASLKGNQVYLNHLGCLLPCDDMEETTFENTENNVTIYSSSLEECFERVNYIISKRFLCRTCEECCGPLHREIREKYPIIQYNREGTKGVLHKFREVMEVV